MAEDAKEGADAAGGAPGGRNPSGSSAPRRQRRGFVSRLWRVLFGRRGEDYEKRLQHLSKEEAAVHARMKRRAQRSRKTARNVIVFSVVCEVAAITYAVVTTRSPDLNWQMRAVCVLPMFILPALSSAIYWMLVSFTRMFDRKDQKTLEQLRAERQAKIDELKEITNYYTTQQLIQKYDLDPAAKVAAATVLASKLGADTGLKVYVGDDAMLNTSPRKISDGELVQINGLRNRKQPHTRRQSTGSNIIEEFISETSPEISPDGEEVPAQTHRVVEHYKSLGTNDGGWIARIAAMLVGEDPTQCYALICGNCHMHNGLARKEDFAYITYYCPHCHALNGSTQPDEHDSGSSSGKISPPSPSSDNSTIARNVSDASMVSVIEGEVTSNLATFQEPIGGGEGEESSVQAN